MNIVFKFKMDLLNCGLLLLAIITCTEGQDNITINAKPSSVMQIKETQVYIDCFTTGTKEPLAITWFFNGYPVKNNFDVEVFKNNTLHIKSLSRTTKGAYTCQAKVDADTTKSVIVMVDIAVLRKIPLMPDDYEFVNKNINITCPKPSRYNPEPKVSWLKNGKQLPTDGHYISRGWSLGISNLKLEDSGNYTCVVQNLAGTKMQTMHFQVYMAGGIKISTAKAEIVEGASAMFTCKSLATPPFPSKNIQWFKIGEKSQPSFGLKSNEKLTVYSNGTIKFLSLVPADEGKYQCRITMEKLTSHYKDDLELDVFEKLKIDAKKQQRQDLDRIVKRNHSLTCPFRGDGPVTVTWSKEGATKLPNRMKPDGKTLRIQDLQLADSGKYTCKVDGKYNSINAVIDVDVLEGSQFTKVPKNITLKEGETGKAECDGKGVPKPKISWVRADASNLPKNFKIVENKTLVIEKAELSNSGEYFCIVANGPASNSVFYVKVNEADGKKGKRKGGQQSMGRTVGIAVGCAGAYIVLVIGLMIYCRSRRSRLLKKQGNVMTEIEDGEFNKDLLENGDDEYPLNGDLKNLEKWQFPREDLTKLDVLGHGKLGEVYTAKARGIREGAAEVLVAVKELAKDNENSRDVFDSELDMLCQLEHENVIKLLGACTNEYPLLIITEYSEHGNLRECLSGNSKSRKIPQSISATQKLGICTQIANGMEYLIANRIIHQDLACRNCLVMTKNLDVKVAFFSLNEDTYNGDYYMFNGTHVPLRWLSPEALFDEKYSEKSGVWAFGVVIWEVYSSCKKPYPEKPDDEVVKYLRKDLKLSKPEGCSDEMFALLLRCCHSDPEERPKFSDIVTSLGEIPIDSNV